MMRTLARLVISAIAITSALSFGAWKEPRGLSSRTCQEAEAGRRKASRGQSDAQNRDRQTEQKLRIGTDLVNVTVTVEDWAGKFVSGLGKEHFEVFDNRVKQAIAHFSDEDAPLSLGIVYDLSGSMKSRMPEALRALKRFIEYLHPDDDLFLITFNDRARLAEDFTTSGERLLDHLRLATPAGSTALYDAAYLAIEKVRQGRHPKKAVLIISDGEDNKSRYAAKELRNRVKESDALIYAIGLTDAFSKDFGSAEYGRLVLTEITRTTGGRAFFPNVYDEKSLADVCRRIALELRRQYSIGFYPTGPAHDGKWHNLEIKIKPPKGLGRLVVRHREGYHSFGR